MKVNAPKLWVWGLMLINACGLAGAYDPLEVPAPGAVEVVDLMVEDAKRQREIPLRVYLPNAKEAAPVVLFSHGLGGSCKGNAYLGEHWAGRGYVAVFVQHPGSDESIWQDVPRRQIKWVFDQAANGENFLLRVKDVPAVLDQLEVWNKEMGHPLKGRLDMGRIGMSGHSFGGLTTQAVSGEQTQRGRAMFTDKRIRAAVVMSPSVPRKGSAEKAFGKVRLPWLLMTGTEDVAPIGGMEVADRLAVYPALPSGGKYELVLDGAEHSAFTDRALPGDTKPRNPNHHRVILALSTAFWDAYLRGDAEAREWLDGEGGASVLEAGDRWQHK